MKKIKSFKALSWILSLALMLSFSSNLVVDAKNTTSRSSTSRVDMHSIFNLEYYTARYPDIKAAYGNNVAAIYNHFVMTGLKEGRQACESFNVLYYRANYPDLQSVFGDNLIKYAEHYVQSGRAEGRTADVDWNGTAALPFSGGSSAVPFTEGGSISSVADAIISAIIRQGMSELEKEVAIHDYIVLNAKYDYNNYLKRTVPASSFTAEGVLINGVGVCEGYAKAAKLLFDKAGIESYIVYGTVNNGKISGNHAWNMVKINGVFYHMDSTWDDPTPDQSGRVRYQYFNLSDSTMSKDHSWSDRSRTAPKDMSPTAEPLVSVLRPVLAARASQYLVQLKNALLNDSYLRGNVTFTQAANVNAANALSAKTGLPLVSVVPQSSGKGGGSYAGAYFSDYTPDNIARTLGGYLGSQKYNMGVAVAVTPYGTYAYVSYG